MYRLRRVGKRPNQNKWFTDRRCLGYNPGMQTTFVAVDVETTGLNPERDAIIEVAAIVFTSEGIEEEFSSFVYPQRDIPPEITNLTGITDEMVHDAPSIQMLRPKLRRVIGDLPIVGHNVGFDLGFLTRAFVGSGNHRLDTVKLASILLPDVPRYSLESLSISLNLSFSDDDQHHRALADARLTVALFHLLLDKARDMGLAHLNEIVQTGRRINWPETLFFEEAMRDLAQHAFEKGESSRPKRDLFNPPKVEGKTMGGAEDEEVVHIDTPIIAGMLSPNGNFAHQFPGYEHREQQVQMVEAVCEAFNQGLHLFIEAGTGTGKSIGYLLPAAFWAEANQRHVVVSTNTINLQDQLIFKDIPQLQAILPFEMRAAILKGKSNYICTRLFEQMRRRGPGSDDEMVVYARVLNWLPASDSGDRSELSLRSPGERLVWSRLSADNDACTRDICAENRCPLHIARQRAQKAHVLIVNHSLLLADVAAGNLVLPPFRELVVDEAHHLKAAVTDGLSFQADQRFLEMTLDEMTRPRAGELGVIQTAVRSSAPNAADDFDASCEKIRQEAVLARQNLQDFFTAIEWFLKEHARGQSQYAQQLRLVPAIRTQPSYDEIEITWENFGQPLVRISDALIRLADIFANIASTHVIEDSADLGLGLTRMGQNLAETANYINSIISQPVEGWIYWIERYRDRITLHAAPLHIGPLVEEHLFNTKDAVVLASATLRTAKASYGTEPGFDYIRDRLHGFEATELAVGSPFDYNATTLVYLPTDIPEPNQPGYQRYVESAILDLATTLNGRTMALFTSYSQLNETAQAIAGPLQSAGIELLSQADGTSRQQLTEQFRRTGARAVLLGTRSFWEGVDIPGPALSALVIVRIPFDVPSDPVFAARSETFDNSFFEYSIPEAVLRFRQGFGRLIRRKDDEGIVLILDKRVISKRYGQMFLEALPDCVFLRQRIGRLSELTERWFSRER